MICDICGNANIIKKDGVYICQDCGTKYSLEEAKKLFKETSECSIENSNETEELSEIEKMYRVARRARNIDYQTASKVYEKILLNNPDDWEALFYLSYCKGLANKKRNYDDLRSFRVTATLSVGLIEEQVKNPNELRTAYHNISRDYGEYMEKSFVDGVFGNDKISFICEDVLEFGIKNMKKSPSCAKSFVDAFRSCVNLIRKDWEIITQTYHWETLEEKRYCEEVCQAGLKRFEEIVSSMNRYYDNAVEFYEKKLEKKEDDVIRSNYTLLKENKTHFDESITTVRDLWEKTNGKTLLAIKTFSDKVQGKLKQVNKIPLTLILGAFLLIIGLMFLFLGIYSSINDFSDLEMTGYAVGIIGVIVGLILIIVNIKRIKRK